MTVRMSGLSVPSPTAHKALTLVRHSFRGTKHTQFYAHTLVRGVNDTVSPATGQVRVNAGVSA